MSANAGPTRPKNNSPSLPPVLPDEAQGAGHGEDLFASEETSLDGWIATFHENERPLLGLAGKLDWRFHGAISQYLKAGAISGKHGECAYIPVTLPMRPDRVYHLFLVGMGSSPVHKNAAHANETVQRLAKNLKSMGLKKLGISRGDFGDISPLKDLPLWITP